MSRVHRVETPEPMDKRKLVLFVVSLALAVVISVVTMWYNIRKIDGRVGQNDLLDSIVNEVRASVSESLKH